MKRHLWPEMLRIIREVSPDWVVGENVLGIVNWNDGMVFDEVQADLEAAGYEVQPFVLPACAVNAPHRRGTGTLVCRTQTPRCLKPPTVFDGEVSSGKANPVSGNSGSLAQEIMSEYPPTMMKLGLIPTPTVFDSTGASANMKSSQSQRRIDAQHDISQVCNASNSNKRDHPKRRRAKRKRGQKQ